MPSNSISRGAQPPLAAGVVLVLVGFSAVVGQIVLMRELMVLFSGNEISMGIALACWLVWTAAGSSLVGRTAWGRERACRAIGVLEWLSAISLPPTIWMLGFARGFFQTVPGELVGPLPMLLTSVVSLSVFCSISGGLFVVAARMYQQECAVSERVATSYAYLLEAAGSGLGGVLTSVLLLRFFGSLQIALMVALLNAVVATSLLLGLNRRKAAAVALAGVILAVPLLTYVAPSLDRSARQRQWKGFRVLESRDTIYGNLTVVETGALRSIYDNGVILASMPDEASAEEAVHYALLEHPAPARVLLIGGAANGSIVQALEHPTLRRLDYVELDPALVEIFRGIAPAESVRALSDARVRVHYADGRLWLRSTTETFDAIVLDLPNPQTAQLNRFYTEEFFRSARDHLSPGGVLAFQVRSSEDFISPELAEFLRCISGSLRAVFPYVAVIPGETTHFFAAAQPDVLTEDPSVLIARLKSRNLQTQYVREYFIPFRMMPDRMEQIHELLQPVPGTPVNRDFQPIAYYFDTVLWSAQFRSGYARAFTAAAHLRFGALLGSVLILLLLAGLAWLALPTRESRERAAALGCMAAAGYILMALEILLLFSFQSVYGYVYHELAILIGMFMAGIGLGSWAGIQRIGGRGAAPLIRSVAMDQLLLAGSAPILLFLVGLLSHYAGTRTTLWTAQFVFPVLALLCGIPGGYQFPLATEICFRGNRARTATGRLYALDLLGGSVGALVLSGYLIPVFGFWKSAWLSAVVSLPPALLAAWTGLGTRTAEQPVGSRQTQQQ